MSTDQGTPPLAVPHQGNARIHQLDGLRGVLALFVVSYHMMGTLSSVKALCARWAPPLLQGWFAVDVFFLMSGFVMMHVYGDGFVRRLDRASYWSFLRARVVRLYPVHLFAMAMMLLILLPILLHQPQVFFASSGRYSLGALVASVFMLHGPWLDYRSWNYPAWSISAEWHAYLLFPLLAPWMMRLRKAPLMWLAVLGTLLPFALYLQDLQPDQYPTNGVAVLARVLPLFIVGMALYRLRPWLRLPGLAGSVLIVPAIICLLCSRMSSDYSVLLLPLLVLAVLDNIYLARWFRARPLLWLGKISYSLYMVHALVETFVVQGLTRAAWRFYALDLTQSPLAESALWLCGIVLALLLGWMTWRWIEVPGRALLTRRWVARRPADTVDVAS